MSYALHFGILPIGTQSTVRAFGITDTNKEYEVYEEDNARGFVSGSWACWGPADQETDGDNSLHVMFYFENLTTALVRGYGYLLRARSTGRILDFAYITTQEDWSEITHVVCFTSESQCYLHDVRSRVTN